MHKIKNPTAYFVALRVKGNFPLFVLLNGRVVVHTLMISLCVDDESESERNLGFLSLHSFINVTLFTRKKHRGMRKMKTFYNIHRLNYDASRQSVVCAV